MANFYNRFLQSVERWPDNIAVEMQHSSGEVSRYSYRELQGMADAVGGWLLRQQVPRGTKCAILAANSPRWVAAYLGILAAGCVVVPLDTAFNPEQVSKLLAASDTELLFADAKHHKALTGRGAEVRAVILDTEGSPGQSSFDAILRERAGAVRPVEMAGDETAAILYTSGTTSDPKGVMLTHDNVNAESGAVFRLIDIRPSDAILGILPLFHALAQMANLILPLGAGARVVYLESLNTTELLRGLRERDITLFCCVPQFYYLIHERIQKQVGARGRLAKSSFRWMLKAAALGRRLGFNPGKVLFRPVHQMLGPKMRYLITGGSRLDPEIGHDFQSLGFELLQAYGLTETSGGAVVTSPEDNVIGSVGKPLYGNEIKILNPKAREEDGARSATHAVGEIALRGPIVMKGYYKRPDATAEVLRDGWLHTGDLGYLDAHGNLFITGREKEVIVLSSGKNVYPEEIEAHYLKSPFIKEICVVGLQSQPGEPYSERLHGVVVPNFELLRERKVVNTREVIRFDIETLSAQLPSTKRILSFEVWQEELPRTTTRKLKRFEIERRVQENQKRGADMEAAGTRAVSEEERSWAAPPEVQRALAVIRERAKKQVTEVHPRDNLELDLGLDSMERVELLVALEKELGADVPDSLASEVYTVREMVDAVRSHVGGAAAGEHATAWDRLLAEEPADPEVLSVGRRHRFAELFWFIFGRFVNLFARDVFRLRVSGVENLPKHGPFILSPNHQSFLDPPVLISCLPYSILRDTFYVGTSEIFGAGVLRLLARSMKLIPVDPDANLIPAMRAGAYGLRNGKVLVLYPEGERSIDGSPKVFKKGAAILSLHLQVPIVPVAMDGFFEAWPRGKGFQGFHKLRIAIGEPLIPPRAAESPEAAYEQLTNELRGRVVEMWEELHEQGKRRAVAAD